jgi:putative ABC transport system permease protein
MGVATAALSVSLDVGDRLAKEFRSLGANLLVTPQADSLPLEIGGVDYRPVNAGVYLPEADLPKLKTIFWHNNIIAFAPMLESQVYARTKPGLETVVERIRPESTLIGSWMSHSIKTPDGSTFVTGVEKTNPWWRLEGHWFQENGHECVVGKTFANKRGLKIGDTLYVYPGSAFIISGYDIQAVRLTITGVLDTGGPEDNSIVTLLAVAQRLAGKPGEYRKLYVSALSKPEDDFARRDPKTMKPDEFERWSCSPYVSSIAYSIQQVLPGADVHVIRRVAEGEGQILTRVRMLLWLVAGAALLAAALAVGASAAASVIERRTEIGLMKALGAGSGTVGFLLAAEQLLLAFVGGGIGYALGIILARLLGERIFGAAP